jgi:hypothetical protein
MDAEGYPTPTTVAIEILFGKTIGSLGKVR